MTNKRISLQMRVREALGGQWGYTPRLLDNVFSDLRIGGRKMRGAVQIERYAREHHLGHTLEDLHIPHTTPAYFIPHPNLEALIHGLELPISLQEVERRLEDLRHPYGPRSRW